MLDLADPRPDEMTADDVVAIHARTCRLLRRWRRSKRRLGSRLRTPCMHCADYGVELRLAQLVVAAARVLMTEVHSPSLLEHADAVFDALIADRVEGVETGERFTTWTMPPGLCVDPDGVIEVGTVATQAHTRQTALIAWAGWRGDPRRKPRTEGIPLGPADPRYVVPMPADMPPRDEWIHFPAPDTDEFDASGI